MYSPACKNVKYTPKITVATSPCKPLARSPSIKAWWAQVTVTPDASSTAVLRRGISKGFKGSIPTGGQQDPNSGLGAKLLWK